MLITRLRRAMALCAAASLAAAAVVVAASPAGTGLLAGTSLQVLGDLAAFTLCAAAAALHTRRAGAAAWALAAAGMACRLIGDSAWLASLAADRPLPEAGWADTPWMASNLLLLAAAAAIYITLRPVRGWQGILDSAALALALAVLAWTAILDPLVNEMVLGAWDSFLRLAYSAAALAGMAAIGWLAVRAGGGPLWMRWILVAFAAQVVGETACAALAIEVGGRTEGLAALAFGAAAWAWAFAALERLGWPQDLWSRRDRSEPPAWTHAIPAGAILITVGVLAWHHRPLGLVIVLATAIAAVRYAWAAIANERVLAERRTEAFTDPLTGAANRRGLAHDLGPMVARARHDDRPLSALAVDLDGFKGVNDTLGHAAGDRLLVAAASAIAAALRPGDRLYRTGGDEFIVLLPGTDVRAATGVAERLRAAVAAAQERPGPRVTASVGVAEGPPRRTEAPETLLDAADAALYRAKAEGRDRVVPMAGPTGSGPGPVLPMPSR